MDGFLGRFAPHIYALLRIVAGVLFAQHGAQKLFGVLGGQQASITPAKPNCDVIETCCPPSTPKSFCAPCWAKSTPATMRSKA